MAPESERINRPVLVCYRDNDSGNLGDRLSSWLIANLGENVVEKIDLHLPTGPDVREHMRKALKSARVMLVFIGPHFLVAPGSNAGLLDSIGDPVRIILEQVLSARLEAIIPVILKGGAMPADARLPHAVKGIVYRRPIHIRNISDAPALATEIRRLLDEKSEKDVAPRSVRTLLRAIPKAVYLGCIFLILSTVILSKWSAEGRYAKEKQSVPEPVVAWPSEESAQSMKLVGGAVKPYELRMALDRIERILGQNHTSTGMLNKMYNQLLADNGRNFMSTEAQDRRGLVAIYFGIKISDTVLAVAANDRTAVSDAVAQFEKASKMLGISVETISKAEDIRGFSELNNWHGVATMLEKFYDAVTDDFRLRSEGESELALIRIGIWVQSRRYVAAMVGRHYSAKASALLREEYLANELERIVSEQGNPYKNEPVMKELIERLPEIRGLLTLDPEGNISTGALLSISEQLGRIAGLVAKPGGGLDSEK